MASEAPAEPVKRGRGRPRKPDSEKKQKPRLDDGTPRRGRGRPKGSVGKPKVLAAGVSKSTSTMNTRSAGTRGRPRKSDAAAAPAASTTKAAGATQTPSKRGRGRPRKSDAAASSPAVEREEPESAASEADRLRRMRLER
ncbi:hypothetical protein HYQ45_012323 [Verticillium longisporum]|uniref:AT hook domain-containing protein n=1 Tax=Verticillium longisporum TaxID=100787 RepID=A0A8I2ZCD3_VERLO|nr:hypothetical protein HYQ44_010466 [Verticillium longisporum]KAG7127831.1 hypothetical protein HYQ45_012323 [Verticillium longisporum]